MVINFYNFTLFFYEYNKKYNYNHTNLILFHIIYKNPKIMYKARIIKMRNFLVQ